MLSPAQALRLILAAAKPLPPRTLPLAWCRGLALAKPVRAPFDYPLFDNSALDGFAVRAADTRAASPRAPLSLPLAKAQFAGRRSRHRLKAGEAWHVTTGAPMPPGSDALIPYEAVRREGKSILIVRPAVRGQNIRRRGEDARRGKLLASKGERLHARRLSMLAAFGVAKLSVAPAPRVALAVSGDELQDPGRPPRPGAIFDSNTPALRGLLEEAGFAAAAATRLPDRPAPQRVAFARLLHASDVLLVAGGMSVGEKDFAKDVLEGLGVKKVFWKVAQKPGKPLYFGRLGRKLVFGLPGNPAAVISCFRVYVLPALRAMAGLPPEAPAFARLEHALPACGDRALFLKAQVSSRKNGLSVRVLSGQGSHLLRSLAAGNALLSRAAGERAGRKGELVSVLSLG